MYRGVGADVGLVHISLVRDEQLRDRRVSFLSGDIQRRSAELVSIVDAHLRFEQQPNNRLVSRVRGDAQGRLPWAFALFTFIPAAISSRSAPTSPRAMASSRSSVDCVLFAVMRDRVRVDGMRVASERGANCRRILDSPNRSLPNASEFRLGIQDSR